MMTRLKADKDVLFVRRCVLVPLAGFRAGYLKIIWAGRGAPHLIISIPTRDADRPVVPFDIQCIYESELQIRALNDEPVGAATIG